MWLWASCNHGCPHKPHLRTKLLGKEGDRELGEGEEGGRGKRRQQMK